MEGLGHDARIPHPYSVNFSPSEQFPFASHRYFEDGNIFKTSLRRERTDEDDRYAKSKAITPCSSSPFSFSPSSPSSPCLSLSPSFLFSPSPLNPEIFS
jgi:hypothetical protein